MIDFARLKADALASGRIGDHEVECICRHLYGDEALDRQVVEFLVDIHREAQTVCPLFERFLAEAIAYNLLAGGSITDEGTAWLRRILSVDGAIRDGGRRLLWQKKLLWQLKRETELAPPEFRTLYDECLG